MRLTLFSLLSTVLFSLWPLVGSAFEVEGIIVFKVEAPSLTLKIISTADTELFTPLVLDFQKKFPTIEISYTTVSSTQLMQAIFDEGAVFDVAISSAMDLQTKLANDGFTRSHSSPSVALLPEWGQWRGHVFSFTQEPAAIVISPSAFEGLQVPRSRQDLISVLRNNPERFQGRVGTYDVRTSGLGYLFATQDARTSETYWRLAEVMGSLNAQLYCCSGDMIEDVSSGKIAVAYNVLGSYAAARTDLAGSIKIIEPQDFTTLMLRSAVILKTAENPGTAGQFVDHLIVSAWGDKNPKHYPFPTVTRNVASETSSLRPIRLGPGLLVFLDDLKRRRFLKEWEDAVLQP